MMIGKERRGSLFRRLSEQNEISPISTLFHHSPDNGRSSVRACVNSSCVYERQI